MLPTLATGPAVASDDEAFSRVIRQSASSEMLDLWPWVNQASILPLSDSSLMTLT